MLACRTKTAPPGLTPAGIVMRIGGGGMSCMSGSVNHTTNASQQSETQQRDDLRRRLRPFVVPVVGSESMGWVAMGRLSSSAVTASPTDGDWGLASAIAQGEHQHLAPRSQNR